MYLYSENKLKMFRNDEVRVLNKRGVHTINNCYQWIFRKYLSCMRNVKRLIVGSNGFHLIISLFEKFK